MSRHKPQASHHAATRLAAVTAMGLTLLLTAPVVAVQAMPNADEPTLLNEASGVPAPAATPVPPASAALGPSATSAFVAITQATTAREQAARHRALVADRADRTKKRIARAKAVARERAARIKARKAKARKWTTPTISGNVSGAFGSSGSQWASGKHTGCDFSGNSGDTVRAVHTGVVIFAGEDGRYGNHIQIRHSNGDQTWYAHLSSISVRVGQKVVTGDRLGRMGQTGNAFGPHLHFEVHIGGAKQASNPVSYLREQGLDV